MNAQTRFILTEADLPHRMVQHQCRHACPPGASIEPANHGTGNARFSGSFVPDGINSPGG